MPVSPTYASSGSTSPIAHAVPARASRQRSPSVEFVAYCRAPSLSRNAVRSPVPAPMPVNVDAPATDRPAAALPAGHKRRASSPIVAPAPSKKRAPAVQAERPPTPPPFPPQAPQWRDEDVASVLLTIATQSQPVDADSATTQASASHPAQLNVRLHATATVSASASSVPRQNGLRLPLRPRADAEASPAAPMPIAAAALTAPDAHGAVTLRFADVGNGPFLLTLPARYVGPALATSVESPSDEPLVPLRINGWEMRMGLFELRAMLLALQRPAVVN